SISSSLRNYFSCISLRSLAVNLLFSCYCKEPSREASEGLLILWDLRRRLSHQKALTASKKSSKTCPKVPKSGFCTRGKLPCFTALPEERIVGLSVWTPSSVRFAYDRLDYSRRHCPADFPSHRHVQQSGA